MPAGTTAWSTAGIITVAACRALGSLAPPPGNTKLALDYILTRTRGPRVCPRIGTHDRLTLLWMLGGAINVREHLVAVHRRRRATAQMTRLTQPPYRCVCASSSTPCARRSRACIALETGGGEALREDTDLLATVLRH